MHDISGFKKRGLAPSIAVAAQVAAAKPAVKKLTATGMQEAENQEKENDYEIGIATAKIEPTALAIAKST